MILVADSSALIALSLCKAIHYLDLLFDEIMVPQAVFYEITRENKKEGLELSDYLKDKIETIDIGDYFITDFSIHRGEFEAMALYRKVSADKLLVDDKRARKIARLNGFKTIGSLGILLAAKNKGLIDKIKPYVEKIAQSNIYIKQELIDYALSLAGEK
ncbi:MAG: DUF3368 domain-containing protein [Candidatus Aminicenantes bacterium]|nr:DUF3368 domain-containing protein [Candidatus Aminicenantes bacterium]